MTRWGTADRLMCALIAVLTFYGCAYTPLKDTGRDERTVTITWRTENVEPECYRITGDNAWGCASWHKDVCFITAPEVQGQDDYRGMELLGHETLHCFRGAWH